MNCFDSKDIEELKNKTNDIRVNIVDYLETLSDVKKNIEELEREIREIKKNTKQYTETLTATRGDLDKILNILGYKKSDIKEEYPKLPSYKNKLK